MNDDTHIMLTKDHHVTKVARSIAEKLYWRKRKYVRLEPSDEIIDSLTAELTVRVLEIVRDESLGASKGWKNATFLEVIARVKVQEQAFYRVCKETRKMEQIDAEVISGT